jgi:membrane protein
MLKSLKNWGKTFWIAGKRLFQEQYTYRASGLAFTTLIALVPLLSVLVSLITVFPIFTQLIELTENYIFTNFIPHSSNIIQKYLEAFIQQATHLPTVGIIFLLFTSFTLIIMVEHTLNSIWSAPKRKKNFRSFFLYWLVLLVTPIFIGLSVLISTYVFSISWLTGTVNKLGLTIPMLASLPLIINTIILSALYIIVPNSKVRFREGVLGGLTAAILFEIAKKAFAFYLKHFPNYELIYGTLATIPIFLIWVYISWLIILYGALVTNTRYLQHNKSKIIGIKH